MADLTEKQESFALAYLETGNAAEAYRRAYDVRAATTHSSIYVEASRMLKNPKITLRIKELQKNAEQLALYNVKSAYEEYEAARKLAHEKENPAAAVSAITGKVKLFGLDNHTKRHEHTGPDGEPIQVETKTWREALRSEKS